MIEPVRVTVTDLRTSKTKPLRPVANPKTFGSDFERGYQAALDDILAWTERAALIDVVALKDEVQILRKRQK